MGNPVNPFKRARYFPPEKRHKCPEICPSCKYSCLAHYIRIGKENVGHLVHSCGRHFWGELTDAEKKQGKQPKTGTRKEYFPLGKDNAKRKSNRSAKSRNRKRFVNGSALSAYFRDYQGTSED